MLVLPGSLSIASEAVRKIPVSQVDLDLHSWTRGVDLFSVVLMLVACMIMIWIARLQRYLRKSTTELQARNKELLKIAADLEQSEKRFRDLFECSPDPVFVEDLEGTVLDVNPAACQLHGRARHDLISRSVFELVPEALHAGVRVRLEQWKNGDFAPAESVTLAADGTKIPVEIRASRMEYFGRQAFLLQVRDVTKRTMALEELRRAKEFSENLIRTANVLIVGLDATGRIGIFNEAAERVTGYTRSEVGGRNGFEILVPKGRYPRAWGEFHRLTAGAGPRIFETPVLTRTGGERIISWQSSHIFENGGLKNLIAFGVDITDRKREEEQSSALERKMLDAQKLESLGVLAGGIAHDFNNLLTAILGNATLARSQVAEGSGVDQFLGEIERTSIQAADLCKQMLAYSGKGALEIRLIDLNHAIEEMKHLLQISVAKKVTLKFAFSNNPLILNCDVTQIRQVVMNLVINASEAIGEHEGEIRVTTTMRRLNREFLENNQFGSGLPEGKYAVIEVTDTGCGMSHETRAKIFDPFFTTKFTGRGLGLAAVHGVIRGHEGLMEIDSDEGIGTTFTIYFPCAEVAALPLPEKNNLLPNARWQGDGVVLVIDDEDAVRMLAERALNSLGFTVMSAADGRDGVEKFRAHSEKIVAVVLDMTMPHLDGKETFPEIRNIRPDVPVLFMSGYTQADTQSFDNTTDFLQKPFQFSQLREKIRGLVDGSAPGG